jgi:hypothetical protein
VTFIAVVVPVAVVVLDGVVVLVVEVESLLPLLQPARVTATVAKISARASFIFSP